MEGIIGKKIKELRLAKGLTQGELAEIIGVSIQAVSKWECGGSPDVLLLPKLADYFEVTIDHLFGRENKNIKLEQLIMRVLSAQPENSRMHRATELVWSIVKASSGVSLDEDLMLSEKADPFDLNCTRTALALDDGLFYSLVQEENPCFFILKDPPEGNIKLMQDSKKLARFYALLANEEFLDLLIFLYQRLPIPLSLAYICKENQLSPEKAMDYVQDLIALGWLEEEEVELAEGPTTLYRPILNVAFVAFLFFSTECLNKISFWYVSNLDRKRPYL